MASSLASFSPSSTYEEALDRAADLWGVEREYWDIWGQKHHASPEGIRAVLESVGIAAGSKEALDEAVEARLWREWSRLLPPTLVISVNQSWIVIRCPRNTEGDLTVNVRWETGDSSEAVIPLATAEVMENATLRGQDLVGLRVLLPFPLRLGYHDLKAWRPSPGQRQSSMTRLIVGPDRAWFPDNLNGNGRAGGVAVSLYGLRSNRNWGCGDFTDLGGLVEWASTVGASFVGLNPLHAIPNRQPFNTSPYLPQCAFYKNLIYIDIEAAPDFANSRWAQSIAASAPVRAEIEALRAAPYVEYERVHRLKLRFLKVLFRTFLVEYRAGTARARQFREYVENEGPLLDQFATFLALDESIHRRSPDTWLWRDWPTEYQDPNSDATRAFAREHWRSVLFYKYIQWLLDDQLGAAHRSAIRCGLPLGLYHDLALATDRYGADLWAHRKFYVEGCRVGAPPDDFSPGGQDWSFPPPHSAEHFRDGYRLFTESIRKNLRHGGALRIDHVMRFFHLFWIPDDLDAKRGIYVRDRHHDLIRILALESVRNRVVIVGEDLGTVAEEVRETLSRFGMLSYRLFYFEKRQDGAFIPPGEYPRQALVSATTHDLPTLAGFWESRDIEARRTAGILPDDSAYREQLSARLEEKRKMLDLLFANGFLKDGAPRLPADYPQLTGDLHNAIVGFLASTPSALMLLNLEDLTKQRDQQNLPGTTAEYPNWRHKTRFSVEEYQNSQTAKDFAKMYRAWLERTNRLPGANTEVT